MTQALTWSACGDALFETAFADVIQYEGGLSNDPNDAGGLTKYGICKYDGLSDSEIYNLTLDQAKAIYKRKYWDACGCALMPGKLAREVFDWQVNSGRGVKLLQELIGSVPDGTWGPHTYNDLKYYLSKHDSDTLVEAYAQEREQIYRAWGVGSQQVFLRGWLNRNEDLASKLGVALGA